MDVARLFGKKDISALLKLSAFLLIALRQVKHRHRSLWIDGLTHLITRPKKIVRHSCVLFMCDLVLSASCSTVSMDPFVVHGIIAFFVDITFLLL